MLFHLNRLWRDFDPLRAFWQYVRIPQRSQAAGTSVDPNVAK